MRLLICNGPNLNLLGKREPEIYGHENFDSFLLDLRGKFPEDTIDYFQSNIEGEIIDKLQTCESEYEAVLLNAGAYTHTSVAIGDAIAAITTPVVEIHISNVFAREDFRHRSYIGAYCIGSISGFGLNSYLLGILSLKQK